MGDFPGAPVVTTLPSNVAGAEGAGLIRGQGATRIPEAVPHGQKSQDMEQKQYCSKFTGSSENGPSQKNLKKKKKDSVLLMQGVWV